jgi:hypothetical protein
MVETRPSEHLLDNIPCSEEANIKLTLHKALIRSVMTYACLAWEFVADTSNETAAPVKLGYAGNKHKKVKIMKCTCSKY